MIVEQDILCVLLQSLKDDNLITQDVHDKAKCNILDTLDWPEFFCYARDTVKVVPSTVFGDIKEEDDGHTQNSG